MAKWLQHDSIYATTGPNSIYNEMPFTYTTFIGKSFMHLRLAVLVYSSNTDVIIL